MGEINKQYLSSATVLIIANIITLISMFVEWNFEQTPFDVLMNESPLITNKYLYMFPIISSIIGIAVVLLLIFYPKINVSIAAFGIFISIGFEITFLIEMLTIHGQFLLSYSGFFVGIAGFGLSFFALFWLLNQMQPQDLEENAPGELKDHMNDEG